MRTTEYKIELEKSHSSASTEPKTAIHNSFVWFCAAELCVCNDETDRPLCDGGKDNQETHPVKNPARLTR